MLKKKSFGKIAGMIVLIMLLWMVFLFSRSLYETSANNNQLYIPENSTMVMRIDGEQLISKGFSDVVLTKKNNKLVNEIIEKRRDPESTNLGLNFRSDIYIFNVVEKNGTEIMGILANVQNKEQLSANLEKQLNSNQGYHITKDVAMILTLMKSESEVDLNKIARDYLREISIFDNTNLTSQTSTNELVHFWAKKLVIPNHAGALTNVSISLIVNENGVSIDGTASNASEADKHTSLVSKNSNFYMESAIIPDALNDFLSSSLEGLGVQLPTIAHVNVNHRYTEHADEGNSILIPHFDASIAFTDSIDINNTLEKAEANGLISNLTKSDLRYGGKQFFYKQTAWDQIYLGRNEPREESISNGVLFEISGSLKPFSEFRGGGLVIKILRMSDLYISSNELFSRIDNVDLSAKLIDEKKCKISGEIKFNDGEAPTDVLLNFLYRSRLLD